MTTAPARAPLPTLALAEGADRDPIFRLRHAVYACELRQHARREEAVLRDDLDDHNAYIAATVGGELAGFVSITPPGRRYSIDKYLPRESLPFTCDEGLYEIRLLTVAAEQRGGVLAPALMYAALRWVEAHGGSHVVALGREEILDLYLSVGLEPVGPVVRSGEVIYHLLHAGTAALAARAGRRRTLLRRLERAVRWKLPFPFLAPPECYHGGAFFEAVGEEFDALDRGREVINADVLDAWFPPSPRVLAALRAHLPWLVRTSPPTRCEGLVRVIAATRGVPPDCVLPGGGSSDLIFLALTTWLTPESRVLVLDPTYGEYTHVLQQLVRCRVDRLVLARAEEYHLDPRRLAERLRGGRYDLALVVNPNSPTGRHVPRHALEAALRAVPDSTRVWIDETYVEYAGDDQSLERFAVTRPNVVVCKSMSKVYALSGMRVAYLCAAPEIVGALRPLSPPWAVGLPAQVAAVEALRDPGYYAGRWRETHALRAGLARSLRALGLEVVPGVANFLLCHLPESGPDAATVVARAREHDLFLRDAATLGTRLGTHALRVAVKDAATSARIAQILGRVLSGPPVAAARALVPAG